MDSGSVGFYRCRIGSAEGQQLGIDVRLIRHEQRRAIAVVVITNSIS